MENNVGINHELFEMLGINLSPEEEVKLIADMMQSLQERIGTTIVDLLDDHQLAELLKVTETGDEAAIAAYIAVARPDYQEIVTDEYDILLGELAEGKMDFTVPSYEEKKSKRRWWGRKRGNR